VADKENFARLGYQRSMAVQRSWIWTLET